MNTENLEQQLVALSREDKKFAKDLDAMLCRSLAEGNTEWITNAIFEDYRKERSTRRAQIALATIQWLHDRGFGKAPQRVQLETDEDSPEGVIARIAREKLERQKREIESQRQTAVTVEVVATSPN